MASGSETPNQDLYNSENKNHASENTDHEILEDLRTEIQIIQATIRGYEAQQHANDRREERRLWIQLVTLVIVVICAALTGLLGREMVRTRKQTEHLIESASVQLAAANQNVTNTGKLASAALDHAKAARDSADAAKDAIKATEGNIRLDQRAWVGVQSMRFKGERQLNQKLEVEIIVHNTGKTPGRDVMVKKTGGIVPQPTQKIIDAMSFEPETTSVILPSNTFSSLYNIGMTLSEADIKLLEGNTALYVFGVITYRDIFQRNHKTYFCGFYNRQEFPAIEFCPALNAMY